MMTYRKFLSFVIPGYNQSVLRLLLIVVSLAFYAFSLDVINCLVSVIKRRLNNLASNLEDGKPLSEEEDPKESSMMPDR
jgi:hypothetical protein